MAGVQGFFTSSEVSLSAGTAKTVLQITAASNHRVKVLRVSFYFKGIVATDTPVKIRICRQTTVIGGTPTAITGFKNNEGDNETIQTTAATSAGGSEPTITDVLEVHEVHPQTGEAFFLPFAQEILIIGGNKLGIEITAAQAQTVAVNVAFEE